MSEFDFEIKHLKGKENRVNDALTRKSHFLYEISLSEIKTRFIKHIKVASLREPKNQFLCKQEKLRNNKEKQLGYDMNESDMLLYRGGI